MSLSVLLAYCKTNSLIADTSKGRVCPLNEGFIVDFISWLVNVYGSVVAFYTHALGSEWVWTHWG